MDVQNSPKLALEVLVRAPILTSISMLLHPSLTWTMGGKLFFFA